MANHQISKITPFIFLSLLSLSLSLFTQKKKSVMRSFQEGCCLETF